MQNPYPKDYGIKLSHAVWTKEITWHDIKIKILFNESGCGYPIMEHIEIRTKNKQKLHKLLIKGINKSLLDGYNTVKELKIGLIRMST